MSSPSKVRLATNDDFQECWRLILHAHKESGMFPLAPDKVGWVLHRVLNIGEVPPEDTGLRGVIGVIGPPSALEGLVFVTIGSFWYTNARHIEECLVLVDPEHRKTNHAKVLVQWMKNQVELTGLPLLTGIISNERTEAKCRLYQRMLPKVGEFFLLRPNNGAKLLPAGMENK